MNRRDLLKMLGLAAPSYFFAPIGGWKSGTIANPFDVEFIEGDIWLRPSLRALYLAGHN